MISRTMGRSLRMAVVASMAVPLRVHAQELPSLPAPEYGEHPSEAAAQYPDPAQLPDAPPAASRAPFSELEVSNRPPPVADSARTDALANQDQDGTLAYNTPHPIAGAPSTALGSAPAAPGAMAHGAASPAAAGAAGAGGGLRYAQAGVTEVGGAMALTRGSATTTFRVAPSAGYFFLKYFEISVYPEVQLLHVDNPEGDANDVSIGLALEPSYHVPIDDVVHVAAGIGLGLRYAKASEFDGFMRTRFGLDVEVGRAGVFKPAAFLDMGFGYGAMAGGLEAGFTLML